MDSRGHIMDSAEQAAQHEKWKRAGLCTLCGKVKTHSVLMGMIRKPIQSVPGQVYKGKCLRCKSITQAQLELMEQCDGVFDMANRASIDQRGVPPPARGGGGRKQPPYSELASHVSEEPSQSGASNQSNGNGNGNNNNNINQRPPYEGHANSYRSGGRQHHGDNHSNNGNGGNGDHNNHAFGRMPSGGSTARSGHSGQRMEENSYQQPSYPQPPHNNNGMMTSQQQQYGGYNEGHHPGGSQPDRNYGGMMMQGQQGRPQYGGYNDGYPQQGMMGQGNRPHPYGGGYQDGQHPPPPPPHHQHQHHPQHHDGYGRGDYYHAQHQHQQHHLHEQHAAQSYPGLDAPVMDVRFPAPSRPGVPRDDVSVISMDPSIMTTDSGGSNRSGSDKKNESEERLENIAEEGERGSNGVTNNENGTGSGHGTGVGEVDTSLRSREGSQGGGRENNPFSPSSPSRTLSNGSGSGVGSRGGGSTGASRVGATSVEGGASDRYNRLLNRKLAENSTKPAAKPTAQSTPSPAPQADLTAGHVHFQDGGDAHMTAHEAQALRRQGSLQRSVAHTRSHSDGASLLSSAGSQNLEEQKGKKGHVRSKTHGDATKGRSYLDKFEERRRAKIAEMDGQKQQGQSPPKRASSSSEGSASYSQKAKTINDKMTGPSCDESNSDTLDSSAKNDSSVTKPGAQRADGDRLLDRKLASESATGSSTGAGVTAVSGKAAEKSAMLLNRKLAGESASSAVGASTATGKSNVLRRKLEGEMPARPAGGGPSGHRRVTEETMSESDARHLITKTSDPCGLIDALRRNTHATQPVVLMALEKLRDCLFEAHGVGKPKRDTPFPDAGWAKILTLVMSCQANNAIVQSDLLHTLWVILTLNQRYISDLVISADMKQVIEVMQNHLTDKPIQEYATGVLATIATNQELARKILGMYDGKVVQRLMAALYFKGEGGNVQVNALKALCRLSSALLASSTDTGNAQTTGYFSITMGRYAEDDPQGGDASVNAVICVLHTMQRHSSNVAVQIEGNRLLWNIFEPDAILDPDYVDILVGNMLQHLKGVKNVHHNSMAFHETSACLLSKMSYFGTDLLGREECLHCVVETMKWQDSSVIVASHGCRSVANVCTRSPSSLMSQPVVDSIPVILSTMENFREHIIIQSEGCAALTAICRNSPPNKERVHQLEGIERLNDAFALASSMTPYDGHCEITKIRAVVALTTLAVDPIVLSDIRCKGILSKFEQLSEEDANLPSKIRSTIQDLLALAHDDESTECNLVFREGADEEETRDCLRANLRVVCTPNFLPNRIASLRSSVIHAMRRFQGSAALHVNGCKLLACLFDLASDEEANAHGEADGQEELNVLTRSLTLHKNKQTNVEAACSALQNYCVLKALFPSDSNSENDSTGDIESLSSLLSRSLMECVSALMIYREDEKTLEQITGAVWALCTVREGLALTFENDTTIGLIIGAMNRFPTSIDLHRHGIGLLGVFFSVSTSNRTMDYVNDDLITSLIRFIHEEVDNNESEDLIDMAVNIILIITHKGFQAVTTLLRNEQLIDSVVSVLFNFPDSLSIQGTGIDILTNIALDNYLRADVCQRGGTTRIIAALDRLGDDSVVVCKAYAALANLISGADVEILRAPDAPAPSTLVNAMRAHQDNLQIQTSAAYALWALSARNDSFKEEIVNLGGAEAISEAMARFVASKQMQAKGFVTLWSLSVPRHLKTRVGRCAIQPAVNGLSAHISSERACEEALGCLKCLSTIPANKNMLEEAGAVDLIYSCLWLHSENSTVCKAALAALCNISVNVDTNEVSEITRDDLDTVVNAMRSHQQVKCVQESAIILLRNFTFSRSNVAVLEQNQFLAPLVGSAMSIHNDHFQGRADDLLRVLPPPNQ